MITISNNSSTLVIILHEIYGINQHMHAICRQFAEAGLDVVCPNLLPSGRIYEYDQAAEAHANFMGNVGFDQAMQQVLGLGRQYRNLYQKLFLIGFSVGATTAWLCGQHNTFDGVIGFYGSRIRDYTGISLSCQTLLFFPRQEISFSISLLLSELSGKSNLRAERVDALHGFSDPWSGHYCQKTWGETFKQCLQFIYATRPAGILGAQPAK